jgi:tRNA-dihydrouridine synthase B
MLKSFFLDGVEIKNPVFLAPMTAVTDLPFRKIAYKFDAQNTVSEMIASMAMIRQTRSSLQKAQVYKAGFEFPAIAQIAGCEPEIMAEAARLNVDIGAEVIDINFGCPVKKVVNSNAGSALMKDPDLACKIVKAVVEAVKVPITVKTRMGWCHNSLNAPELAKRFEEIGIKMITIHGRTRSQLYNGKADWNFVKNVKESVKIPVVVNGDIKNFADAKQALELSGADGVMIGRGSYGKPWIVGDIIKSFANGKQYTTNLTTEQLYNTVSEHIEEMYSFYGKEGGMLLSKKHVSWYSKGLIDGADFRAKINLQTEPDLFLTQTKDFFKSATKQDFVDDCEE